MKVGGQAHAASSTTMFLSVSNICLHSFPIAFLHHGVCSETGRREDGGVHDFV